VTRFSRRRTFSIAAIFARPDRDQPGPIVRRPASTYTQPAGRSRSDRESV